MHLTKRFFVMNALSVLLSIALTALAVIIFVAAYTKVFGNKADINELKRAYEVRTGISEIKREAMVFEFKQLLDKKVQQELADRAQVLGAHAFLFINREVVYATRKLNAIDIEKACCCPVVHLIRIPWSLMAKLIYLPGWIISFHLAIREYCYCLRQSSCKQAFICCLAFLPSAFSS